ncbi:MAG: hypothetical protein ACRDKG_09325 [Actinomycetota bacterium]
MEETIAALHEELEFTTNFAHAMVREENYRAAAQVIDEQRKSLVRATDRIEKAMRAPEIERSKMRARAALVGLAATLALGSGAFAAFGPGSTPPTQAKIEAIQDFSDALDAAVAVSDPIALSAIVAPEQERILAAAQSAASNPEVKATLLASVEKLQQVISNPNLPARVRARAQEVVETVQQIVVSAPEVEAPIESETEVEKDTEVKSETETTDAATTSTSSSAPTP